MKPIDHVKEKYNFGQDLAGYVDDPSWEDLGNRAVDDPASLSKYEAFQIGMKLSDMQSFEANMRDDPEQSWANPKDVEAANQRRTDKIGLLENIKLHILKELYLDAPSDMAPEHK